MKIQLSQDSIHINSIDFKGSICDGPGIRTVIYLQGCNFHCVGCHNPQTWDMDKGYIIPVEELFGKICRYSMYKRITISGGEPLIQKDAVYKLTNLLKTAGFDIALYTGFDISDVPTNILITLNYIKCGKYIESLRSTTTPYIGSSNQIFKAVNGGEINEK